MRLRLLGVNFVAQINFLSDPGHVTFYSLIFDRHEPCLIDGRITGYPRLRHPLHLIPGEDLYQPYEIVSLRLSTNHEMHRRIPEKEPLAQVRIDSLEDRAAINEHVLAIRGLNQNCGACPEASTCRGEESRSPAMMERGIAFPGGEGGYSRLVGAGLSDTDCVGNWAARQRARVYLMVKLHICLFCSVSHISLF